MRERPRLRSKTGTAAATCVALLQEGATCAAGMLGTNPQDPCDNRLGLTCQPTDTAHPTAGSTCQGAYVVPNGATCGMVLDGTVMHNHVCSDYSYCDTTSVCQPKVMEGQGCVNDGCYPPYVCTVGTCQAPTMQVDPTCNPVTMPAASVLACGPTPGRPAADLRHGHGVLPRRPDAHRYDRRREHLLHRQQLPHVGQQRARLRRLQPVRQREALLPAVQPDQHASGAAREGRLQPHRGVHGQQRRDLPDGWDRALRWRHVHARLCG